jgi:MFS family permease
MGTPGRGPAAGNALGPLKVPVFRLLWVATILGNVGTFVRDVASAWLATDLGGGAVAVAAVQAAATLPICLLAIPAGVLSDTLDRRRLLMAVQLFLAVVTLALLGLAWRQDLGLTSLVALSFLGGAGAALMAPAWQAIVPELVGRPLLREAVALNSLALNVSRSIGPALGGLLVAVAGAVAAYGVHVLSSLAVLVALQRWRRAAPEQPLGSEPFGSALAAGLRFALASPGCGACWGWPACTSAWPAPSGPCCRCWCASAGTAAPASTACCWARWAWAPSAAPC